MWTASGCGSRRDWQCGFLALPACVHFSAISSTASSSVRPSPSRSGTPDAGDGRGPRRPGTGPGLGRQPDRVECSAGGEKVEAIGEASELVAERVLDASDLHARVEAIEQSDAITRIAVIEAELYHSGPGGGMEGTTRLDALESEMEPPWTREDWLFVFGGLTAVSAFVGVILQWRRSR